MTDLILRFKMYTEASDTQRAKHCVADFTILPTTIQNEIIHCLALAQDTFALELIQCLLNQKLDRSQKYYEHLVQLIIDRAHLNFEFIQCLYNTRDPKKITLASPLMKHILVNETDENILEKTIQVAGMYKIQPLVDAIAEYLYFDDQKLKTGAVDALKTIGSPNALKRLEEAAQTIKCDQNILNAINEITSTTITPQKEQGNKKRSMEDKEPLLLFEKLSSHSLSSRYYAFSRIPELGTGIVPLLVQSLQSENHDLVINTLRIISRMIPENIVGEIYGLISQPGLDSAILFSAYEALRAFPSLESSAAILEGIDQRQMHVRLAAIKALDKHISNFICTEIKNRIESGKPGAASLTETIIDAQADAIIEFLMLSDTFVYIAYNYLSKKAPLSPLKRYIKILQNRGMKSTSKKFQDLIAGKQSVQRPSAVIISGSLVVQRVYEKTLFTNGYTPILFQSPQEAFELIAQKKPDIVIADLFFNTMTGIDLAREFREFYTKDELVIILSTFQKDFAGSVLKDEIAQSGVHAIVEFPATIRQINAIINK